MAAELPRAAIFDMDGTLCDVSSLRHHVDRSHPGFAGRRRFETHVIAGR